MESTVHSKVKLYTGIQTSMLYTEIDACIAAGLNPDVWINGVLYSAQFKEMIIAWYDQKAQISLHTEDARYRKSLK